MYCWGRNEDAELGLSDYGPGQKVTEPIEAINLPSVGVLELTTGARHACVLLDASPQAAYCWGNNDDGQIGNGTTSTPVTPPDQVVVFDSTLLPAKISAGGRHTCALSGNGVYCWGSNDTAQSGLETTMGTQFPQPTLVGTGNTFFTPAAGGQHTCALGPTALDAYCFGLNNHYQLGNDTGNVNALGLKVTLPGSKRAFRIAVSKEPSGQSWPESGHTCAVDEDHAMYCWGNNSHGQLGDGTSGTSTATPMKVEF